MHGFNDELVLNFREDYPGGVVSHGNLEVQKSGTLKMRNRAGNVTTTLDNHGNVYLGGHGTDGDVVCRNGDGKTVFHLDAQHKRIAINDKDGTTRVCIVADDFTDNAWPAWPGKSVPSQLDLIAEIRRLKEELLALRAQVDALTP